MRCIFIREECFEVHTHWGWFRLDEGAYRDYLAGKLWICWKPRGLRRAQEESGPLPEPPAPPNVSEEALRLRDEASRRDAYLFLRERFPGVQTEIPCKARMSRLSISELSLSVRSSNCLMRAGADTFGALRDLIRSETGLRAVRNLGSKSEEEIRHCFFCACYYLLTPNEKARYWQEVMDRNA